MGWPRNSLRYAARAALIVWVLAVFYSLSAAFIALLRFDDVRILVGMGLAAVAMWSAWRWYGARRRAGARPAADFRPYEQRREPQPEPEPEPEPQILRLQDGSREAFDVDLDVGEARPQLRKTGGPPDASE